MTPLEQAITCLHIALSALALWFTWQIVWKRSCQDRFRQNLFEIRDELFDFARQGGIAFTDPAYVALRWHINSLIRFSHRINIVRLALFVLLQRFIGDLPEQHPYLPAALAHVKGRKAKETLTVINGKVSNQLMRLLILSSPSIVVVGPALYVLDGWINLTRRPAVTSQGPSQPPIVTVIELQARKAYRSEAVRRTQETEIVAAMI